MCWSPCTPEELRSILETDLTDCSEEDRAFLASVKIEPVKWCQSPWGDQGGGFWAVAICEDRVLWYNDIEDGFNVSNFTEKGVIPEDGYFCNQDELRWALPLLKGLPGGRLGPPQPLD